MSETTKPQAAPETTEEAPFAETNEMEEVTPSKRGDVVELNNPPVSTDADPNEMISRIETAMAIYVGDSESTAMQAAAGLVAFAIADAQHPEFAASDPADVKELVDKLNAEQVDENGLEEVAQIFDNWHTAIDTPFTLAMDKLAQFAIEMVKDPESQQRNGPQIEEALTVLAQVPGATSGLNLDAMAEAVKAEVIGRAEEVLAGLEGEARAVALQATADVAMFAGMAVMDPNNADRHRQSAEHAVNTLESLGAEQAGVLRAKIAESVQHVIAMAMRTVLQAAMTL